MDDTHLTDWRARGNGQKGEDVTKNVTKRNHLTCIEDYFDLASDDEA